MAKRQRADSLASLTHDEDGAVPDTRSQSAEAEAHTPKYTSLDPAQTPPQDTEMECLLPPHKRLKFSTHDDYESHYLQFHTNRCTTCDANFPTPHFLDLHIAENHDPLLSSRRDTGEKTYACFVEGCDKVCVDWKKRRSHLVDKHGYPRNYDFLIVDSGIDKRMSMLRPGVDAQGHRKSSRERRRSDSETTENTRNTGATSMSVDDQEEEEVEVDGAEETRQQKPKHANVTGKKYVAKVGRKPEAEVSIGANGCGMDDLTSSMSSLKMVPRTVTFGKRKGRSGFAKS